MRIYFFDNTNRYIGNRELLPSETIPTFATTTPVSLTDGQHAHWNGTKWTKSIMPVVPIEAVEQEKSIEQRIEEMAEQLVLAQEALDFLIMGGM